MFRSVACCLWNTEDGESSDLLLPIPKPPGDDDLGSGEGVGLVDADLTDIDRSTEGALGDEAVSSNEADELLLGGVGTAASGQTIRSAPQ